MKTTSAAHTFSSEDRVAGSSGPASVPGHSVSSQFVGRPRPGEKVIKFVLATAAILTVLITIGILIALIVPGLEFFFTVPLWDFLFGTRWTPMFADKSFGVLPLVSATIWTTSLALLIAIPFGLGAAILLSEFAHPKLRAVLKPILEMLAGVPTVVYGLFALQFIQLVVFKEWLQLETGAFSVLAAGLVMGIMIIPTIAAIILGVSRAVGETMIVAIAAGSQARIVTGPLEAGQTMTGFIANSALGDSRVGSIEYNTLFAVGLLLFVITLVINIFSIRLVNRFRQVY
jgi:phosphate transport system permease protein